MIAMPTHRDIPFQTAVALLRTQRELLSRGLHVYINVLGGCSLVHKARCLAAADFLRRTESRLFWIDSDMVWQPDDFMRLLALSTKMDVVCAGYANRKNPEKVTVKFDAGTDRVPVNEHGCFPIAGAGLGFACITRDAMTALAMRAPQVPDHDTGVSFPAIFRTDIVNGEMWGEDMLFFRDLREAGFQPYLDPSITLGHLGTQEYRRDVRDLLKPVYK